MLVSYTVVHYNCQPMQTGLCWIVMPNGTRLPEPFLNISELVQQSSGYSEEGFLSLAFHPQFATNRKLYVYYSYRVDNAPITRLSEMLTFESNPNKVNQSTARHLLTIAQPYTNHNGGRVSHLMNIKHISISKKHV